MMSNPGFRRILATCLAAAACLAVNHQPASAARAAVLERFVAAAISPTDPGVTSRIDIFLERWSTDEEALSLRETLGRGPDSLLSALQKVKRPTGVVLMPGLQGLGARARTRTPRALRFAREIVTPAGRQIVLACDEHLGLGEAPRDARARRSEFSLIDIRFAADGTGTGKLASAEDVTFNATTGTIEMKNYERADLRLMDVRTEQY